MLARTMHFCVISLSSHVSLSLLSSTSFSLLHFSPLHLSPLFLISPFIFHSFQQDGDYWVRKILSDLIEHYDLKSKPRVFLVSLLIIGITCIFMIVELELL